MNYHFANTEFEYDILYPEGKDEPFVDFYCQVSFSKDLTKPVHREILPFPGCEMTWRTSGNTYLEKDDMPLQLSDMYILGQPSVQRCYSIDPGTTVFFVRLKQYLLKSSLQQFSSWKDTCFEFGDIWSDEVCTKLTQISTIKDFADKSQAVKNILGDTLINTQDKNFNWLLSVQDELANRPSVAALAQQLHISIRQLERRFKTYFDLTPTEYIRLLKLADALDHYARSASTTITSASYEGNFADQAHFIKTFRSFTKDAPLKFFKKHNIKKK